MATQADIPEVILHKRLEVEETSLTTGQFEKNLSEYFPVEGKKYESQLNEGLETQECQAESETKQVASSVQVEVTSNVVNGNSGTIEDGSFLTSPSGPTTSDKEASEQEDRQVDELKPTEVEIAETAEHLEKGEKLEAAEQTTREDEVMEEKSPKADQVDKNLGQNVEVILNQQDSAEREIEDSEKDERAGEMEDSHAKLSSKEIPSEPEVNLDHKHVQSIVETCPKEENVDNTSSTEATFLKKEFTEEKIFEETKEEDKRVDSVPEEKSSEAICSSDNGGIEDEKNQMQDDAGDASLSTIALSRDESQTHERGESAKDEVERINVANEPVDQEAGVTEKEKNEEKDEAPIETEIPDKDSADTLLAAKAEEVCSSQEVDSSEILKVSSKIGSELITREIPVEVTSKIEILEEPTQVRGTASGDVNTIESYEKELDISSRNNEDEIHRTGEGLDITQAAVEEAQHTEEYSHVAAEDISIVKLIQAEEHTEVESKKHEDHADDNLLPSNEPEEKKFQTNFNVAAKEIESETLRGETTTVTPIKEETTNLPLTHSDQKTESTEAELPNNDANNSNACIFLVEQSEVQSEKIGEVSDLGSHEKYQTSDDAPENEKLVEAESDGHQSTEKTIVTSTEGKAPTDVISKESENTKETEKDYGVSSKESFESQGAQENESEEIKKEAEVIDLDVQKFTSSQESEECSTLDDVPAEVDSTVREIPEEEAPKPIGEDETHKKESVVADFNQEKISERDVAFSTPESVQEGTSKSSEDNVKDEKKLNEEESPAEIIKEGNTTNLSLEDIQKDATETLKDHEHEAEKSKEEVVEELETVGAGESIPSETNKDIETIFDASSVKQEEGRHEEVKYLDRNEDSIEESKVEIVEEEALKLRGEDEGQTQESTEENVEKEEIIKRDVTLSTTESVQEETSKSSQENIKDAENLNEEESTVDIIKEGKLDDLSSMNTLEDSIKTGEDRENEAEKSKEEIVKELETTRAGESSPWETKKDVESFVDTSSEKHEEVKYHDQDPIKASIEENKVEISEEEALKSKHEDESHRQEAESNKEQIIREDATFSAVEAIQEETSNPSQDNVNDAEKLNEEESTVESLPENNQEVEIKKSNDQEYEAEKSTEQVVQKSDSVGPNESISFETDKDVEKFVEASPIKQEESQQEGGKYQDIIKASTEKNKDETPEEEAPKSKSEDEQIVEQDVTFSMPESIQEEISERSQEEINEEYPAVITKEGNISDLSPENIEEDATEVLKDRENELEESKKEVVEEFETTGPGESILYETNKDIERSGNASSVKQEEGKQEEVKYLDPTRASVKENTLEISDEEASKSRGDDESHGQENAGADFDREKIIEREVTFSMPESIQEETSKTSQDNVKDVENLNEEESTVESIPKNNQEVKIKKSNDHEYEAEKSIDQVVQESNSTGPSESTSFETNKDVEKFVGASSIKQEESQQEDGKYQDAIKASTEENKYETPEEEALKSKGEDEEIFEDVTFSAPESIQEEISERSQEEINEEHPAVITNEGNISDLSPENIEENAIEVLKDQENEVEQSKKEVVEEFKTTGLGESIPYETNKDIERSEDASLVKQEEGKQEEVKYLDPTRASVEEDTPEILDEETSKSRGDDESRGQENAGADFDREKIIEREVTFSMPELIQEETNKTSQDNVKHVEKLIEEESTVESIPENNQEVKIKKSNDHEYEAEKSTEQVVQESDSTRPGESTSFETNKDAKKFVEASPIKQEESQQEDDKYQDAIKASTEENKDETPEEEAPKSKGEDEQFFEDVTFSAPKSIQEETSERSQEEINEEHPAEITKEGDIGNLSPTNIKEEATEVLKDQKNEVEESKKEVIEELETAGPSEIIQCETNKDVEKFEDASLVKQEEGKQKEVKYLDLTRASVEENTPKIPEEEASKSRGDDESHRQENAGIYFDREKIIERDVTLSTPESIQEETSKTSQDNLKDEESTTEITKEGIISNLSQENVQEDIIETLKDHENEVEKSKEEAKEELETDVAGESISHETTKNDESFTVVSSVMKEEARQEEGKYIDPNGASIENKKLEISEEEALKSRGKDESHKQESVAVDFDKEQVVGEEVISIAELIQKETSKSSCDDVKDVEKIVEESILEITKEGSIKDFSPENTEEAAIESLKDKETDVENSKEVVHELETSRSSESFPRETNVDVKSSTAALSVKQEESQQEEREYLDQVEALMEEKKCEDKFSTDVVKTDDENKVTITERGTELPSKGDEDQQQARQDKPEEKLGDSLHVSPEKTETEKSSEITRELTNIEAERTIQNLNQTSEIEEEGERSKNTDDTNDSEKETPKEIETEGAGESISRKINEDAESSGDALSVKQEERQQEEIKVIDQATALTEESKIEEKFTAEVLKDDEEIKASDASSKGEEGDGCEEKLENFPHEKLKEIVTKTSTENARSITYMEVEETAHNLEETSETEKIMCMHDTNDSAEIPKELETAGAGDSSSFKKSEDAESSVDASSVKQEESHEEEVKYIDHVKSSTEKNKVDGTYSTEVDKEDDDSKVEVIEKKLELETKDGEDKEQAVQKDEPGEKIEDLLHIPKELETTGENDSKISVDTSSLKQEESQEKEVKHIDQAEVSIEEKNFEETSATELAKDEDESKVSDVALKGEEDQQQATQKDEPAKKLENLLPETSVETETETSTENARNITDIDVERATQNLAETAEKEKTKHVDTTNDEKEIEIPQELETAGTIDEDVERSVVTSSVKQEEDKELDQVEASKEENKVDDSFSTEVVAKEDYDSKIKLAEREIEEDLKLAPQKDELGEKFEDVLQVTPKETETDTSSGNATSTTCVEREGTIQDVEETSEMENIEENEKNTDNENDSQKEIPKEFEAAGACESSSYKISEEAESSVDASSIKQEESQQEEVKYIDQVESSTEENKVEDAYSTEADKEDDGSKVEVTEKRIEGESKDEEDQQQAVQKDKPQEKYEDLLHVIPEETETESSREIATEFTHKEVEETVQDLDTTSKIENEGEKTKNVDGTSISEKEVRKESETSEAGVSIDTESSVDASSLKQDASQEEEVKYIDQAEAPIEEKKLEETFTTEVVKDDDESKVTHVALEGEEDHRQPTQKDEPGEKLEILLPEMPVQTETETSIENARNITDVDVDGTSQNLEETAELEKTEHVDTTNESEKEIEIPRELETTGTVNEDVERSVVTSLVKQEEENELDQVEASKEENKLEDSFSTELVKEDDDNKLKATEREIKEDLQPAPQKDEPGEKLEDVLQVAPEETETEASSGNATSVTCVEGKGTIQDVAETSKTENKEETQKNSDDANVSEKEALETTNASQETRDEISREIGSVEEFSNKRSNTETTEETKEDSVEKISKEVEKVGIFKKEETGLKEAKTDEEEKIKSSDDALEEKGVEKGGDSISTEIVSEERVLKEAKPDDEEQITSFDAASEEKGVSSSRDIGSESKSVLTGISNEEARLKEAETIVEEQVKSCHIVTEEKGMERNVDVDVQSDFSSTRIKKEETSSKEAESETVEHVKSYDVAPEEKGLTSNAVCEEKSDSISTEILGADIASEEKSLASGLDTEIVNEETSLTEAKAGDEERVQSRGFAPENEDLVRDAEVDVQSTFVSAETKSEETVVKETETDHEEPIGSSNIAFEENNLTSSLEVKPDYEEQVKETVPETESLVTYVDTKIQPDSISADIESEGTCLKEDKPENEDKVRSLDIAPQEESSVRAEIRLKETESDNKEDVKNSDLVLEEESLVNEEVGLKEVESDNKEEVKNYDIAPEEKGVSRSSIVVGDEQQNEKSEESKENKAPEVIGKFEEKIEQEIKGETPIAEIENKEQDTKVETSLEESSEDNLQDSSVAPPINDEPATTEATEKSDVNHLVIEPTKGEGLLQEEGGSKLESDDAENNITNEEIQKQKDVEITTKDAFPTEVHESIEKAEENESSKEQVTDGEINLKEYQPVSIVDERDYEENDFGPILSEVRDAQLAGTDSEERNLVLQKSKSDILQAQKVDSVTKLEERSFDLDQVDEKETEKKTIVEESYAVNEAKETKLASETKDVDATWPTPAAEKLKTVESKEIMEATEFQGIEAVNEDEITSEQAPDDGTSKGNGHETETTVETEEEIIKEVDLQDKEKTEASSPTHLKREEPGGPKLHEEAENDIETAPETVLESNYEGIQSMSKDELHEEAENDIETAPETVLESNYESIQSLSKDEVIADQDHHVGVLNEQVEELQTIEDETTEDLALPTVTSKDEVQVPRLEEQDEEKASDFSATKTADEEIKALDSLTNVSGSYETQEETKEASKTVCESDSRSIGVITEDKKITGETFAENQSEVQLLDQSYVLLPKEQEDGITATAKEIEEKTIEETSSQKEVEEITEASETVSKESAPDTEVVSRGIYTDQALPIDKDESITDQALKIPSSSTSVPDEQKHDIAATVKNVEEEETKVEVTESVGGTRYADSPSEVLETREAFIEASNLNVEKREIASEFVYGKAESPEARTSIEEVEIIENHLKVATTDVRTEEPQFGTTIQAENTTKKEISEKEELRSREILEAKSGLLDVKEVQETIQETKQPEQSSQETSKESLETRITDTPPKLTDPVEETSQTTEPKDTNPRNNIKLVNREITAVEIKEEECEEKETGGTKTESTPVISLSELMQTSKDEKVQVAAEHSIEAEKAKTDEERDEEEQEEDNEHAHEHEHEGHEHEEEDHPDAPIIVQSSRDIDSKGGRKKSHGLFSGVGSKVKHSISKVKKAITGKSSHSKTLPQ
ncbi:hypothetical protein TIFTF001_011789 [Ficus carica]|uniref:Titin-like n=1 Tax=Ficus carica TaxID=3494 RepID=A0AA88AEU5_FICCA|nr:hypothetical protein TIFTF001_011789 [Ficus carica]